MRGLITAEELKTRVEAGIAPIIVDVRDAEEFESGFVPGSIHLPIDQFEAKLAEVLPNKQKEVVLICSHGRRSAAMADQMHKMGFSNVKSIVGGYDVYKDTL